MTSKEFVLWLQGFTQGVHEHNITPKQWDALKDVLSKVNDEPTPSFPFGVPNTGIIQTLQPYATDPYNPYTINCASGSSGTTSIGTITTTPGITGFIKVTNSNLVSFSTGSTSTAYGYPSGSAWHYTTTHNHD
jgi:hypothetical protein